MRLPTLELDELPEELQDKPRSGEIIHHFGYIDEKGGCANPSSAKQWILVTNKRVLFEATLQEGEGLKKQFVRQSGSIPIAKVSYVGTNIIQEQQGCNPAKETTILRIKSSGGEIQLVIPTKNEADRAYEVIDEILSRRE